jgi:hypothetical protein
MQETLSDHQYSVHKVFLMIVKLVKLEVLGAETSMEERSLHFSEAVAFLLPHSYLVFSY